MQKLGFILISLFIVFIVGCNGHSENSDITTPQVVTSISFSILDNQGNTKTSFDKDEVVTLQAIVYDENNRVIANKAVDFTSTIGTLTVSSKLTNSDG